MKKYFILPVDDTHILGADVREFCYERYDTELEQWKKLNIGVNFIEQLTMYAVYN